MAEFPALDSSVSVNAEDIAELDRQWAEAKALRTLKHPSRNRKLRSFLDN